VRAIFCVLSILHDDGKSLRTTHHGRGTQLALAMPKQRLTSLDIHAVSSELQSLISYRLQNIYGPSSQILCLPLDINSRTFLLKFGLPDSKKNVIIESGFRIHLTSYSRDKSSTPSHFIAKVTHLRNALTIVTQVFKNETSDGIISIRK
jgi:predicted ribosome quality control (RQC) complex YloA/Tae2 family protein